MHAAFDMLFSYRMNIKIIYTIINLNKNFKNFVYYQKIIPYIF